MSYSVVLNEALEKRINGTADSSENNEFAGGDKPLWYWQPFSKERWERYPFASEEKLEWFRRDKFGFFLSVGINSLGKVDIGWPRHTHKLPDPRVGEIPDEVYDGWAKQFEFDKFSAEEWAQLAVDGGMRYVVIIAKHHDGFHMWDTEFSDYKVTNTPFKRDYLKELIDAFRAVGIKIGIYYSQRDWVHPDYMPVDPEQATALDDLPFFKMNDGKPYTVPQKHKKYIEYMHNTVLELMKNYGKIDILWWDAAYCCGMYLEEMWDSERLEKQVRELQPDILINNRANCPGDFDTPECIVGMFQNTRCWETCMPLGQDWAYNGNQPKSFETVLSHLVNCVCGDGNYLLSVGAMPEGSLAQSDMERIRQVGRWLKAYGDSIYSTRGGPWVLGEWGGSCYRDNVVYLHILDKKLARGCVFSLPDNEILRVQSLTGETPIIVHKDNEIQISIKEEQNISYDCIVELVLKNPINMDIVPFNYKTAKKRAYCECEINAGDETIIEIPSNMLVSSILLTPENTGEVQVKVSDNNVEWEDIFKGEASKELDIVVNRYDAGAYIVGRPCKKIKINADINVKCEVFTKEKE